MEITKVICQLLVKTHFIRSNIQKPSQISALLTLGGFRHHQRGAHFSSPQISPLLYQYQPCQQLHRQQHNSLHAQTSVEDTDVPDVLYRQVDIELKGHDAEVLKSYQTFCVMAANELDICISKIFTPPKLFTRITHLKSVHIYKKHRVQYEIRTHYKTLQLEHMTGATSDTYMEYIQRNLPEGVAMKVTKYRIEALPEHIKHPEKAADS